ncbi:DUF4166 domain-containing protein [Lysinibacillus sp. 54212]|uniref:DUF4166 domain-containing protein n=1 Tax=Lysinibacillus sp. 54212 TaxID=3119829 RepID=UPI002FC74DBA
MNIYSTLLGENFSRLHPKLQQRYMLSFDKPFEASGTMRAIKSGTKLLFPFYKLVTKTNFLFPEFGRDIPFQIKNTAYYNSAGERAFHFPHITRYFNAKMTIDQDKKIVKDYLGDPSFFYSDLRFDVTKNGHLLVRSGKQKLVFGSLELPFPQKLEGRVIVEEGYDDRREVFTIHVSIYNDILGRIMMYAGEFTEGTS